MEKVSLASQKVSLASQDELFFHVLQSSQSHLLESDSIAQFVEQRLDLVPSAAGNRVFRCLAELSNPDEYASYMIPDRMYS